MASQPDYDSCKLGQLSWAHKIKSNLHQSIILKAIGRRAFWFSWKIAVSCSYSKLSNYSLTSWTLKGHLWNFIQNHQLNTFLYVTVQITRVAAETDDPYHKPFRQAIQSLDQENGITSDSEKQKLTNSVIKAPVYIIVCYNQWSATISPILVSRCHLTHQRGIVVLIELCQLCWSSIALSIQNHRDKVTIRCRKKASVISSITIHDQKM